MFSSRLLRFRRITCFVTGLALVASPLTGAGAGKPADSKLSKAPAEAQTVAGALIEQVRTPEHALVILAMAGASEDTLKIVGDDLKKRLAGAPSLPALQLKDNNKVFADGQFTGIKITSFSPLNVQYQGRLWSSDKSKSLDANYLSLTQFLEGKKTASLFSLFVDEANAQAGKDESALDSGGRGAVGGAMIGTLAAIGVAFIPGIGLPLAAAALSGAAMGAGAGGVLGAFVGDRRDKDEKALVSKIVNGNVIIECSPEKATVKLDAYRSGPKLEIDKKNGKDPIRLLDEKGQRISSKNITEKQKKDFADLYKCNSESDAKAMMAENHNRREAARYGAWGVKESGPALRMPTKSNGTADH